MQFETLATGPYLEALLIDGADVWYSDVAAGGIYRLSPGGGTERFLDDRKWVGGLLMNEDGRLLVSGEGGIVWLDPATGGSGEVLAFDPGVNEMRPDGRGGLWFGSVDLPSILRGERPRPATLCRLDRDLVVTCPADGLAFTNGLNLSPDGRRLYLNETFGSVLAFDVAADGGLSGRTVLADKHDCDGLALDAEGRLWITGFGSDHILILQPNGQEAGRVPLPGPATNVRFGGADMRDLHVTLVHPAAAAALARGELPTEPSSRLCRGRADTAGAPIPRVNLRLP